MQSHSFRFAERGGAIFSPWSTVLLLALESSEVIGLRVAKLAGGGVDARHEAHLIVSEKVDAVFEVSARLMSGATANAPPRAIESICFDQDSAPSGKPWRRMTISPLAGPSAIARKRRPLAWTMCWLAVISHSFG